MRATTAIALLFLLFPPAASAGETVANRTGAGRDHPTARAADKGDSLFVWGRALAMTDGLADDGVDDRERIRELVRFAGTPGIDIDRLYFLVAPGRSDPTAVRTALRAAAAADIEVYALHPGSLQDTWAARFGRTREADHGVALRWLAAIAAIERDGTRFAGIQLDVEPHAIRGRFGRRLWRADGHGLAASRRNRELAAEFVELLREVARYRDRHAPHWRVGATIPAWFDRDDDVERYAPGPFGAENLAAAVQREVDHVTVMAYTDAGDGVERSVLDAVLGEIARGPTEVVLETAKPGRRGPRRGRTLYREGLAGYAAIRAALERRYGRDPNYVGCAAHHYGAAFGAGTKRWPDRSRRVRAAILRGTSAP